MRSYGLDRWNWSPKAKKWVYVEHRQGKRVYKYRESTPQEFENLTDEIFKLNRIMMEEEDAEKQTQLYKKLMILSQKLQQLQH
jgi:hypothetical protein